MNWTKLVCVCAVVTMTLADAQSKPACSGTRDGIMHPMQPFLARSCQRLNERIFRSMPRSGNIIFSPVSLCSFLAAFTSGSGNKTLAELKKTMSLYVLDRRETSLVYGRIHESFADVPNLDLVSSSMVFFDKDKMLVKHVAKTMMKTCNGTFNPEGQHGFYNYKLSEGYKSGRGLVVASRFTLRGSCTGQFRGWQTKYFSVNKSSGMQIRMMRFVGRYRRVHSRSLKSSVLELPLEGDRFTMYVILPSSNSGLAVLERRFARNGFAEVNRLVRKTARPLNTEVFLPKFGTGRESLLLNKPLQQIGITSLFDQHGADLSRMFQGTGGYVKYAFQQSAIEIEGIEREEMADEELEVNATERSSTVVVVIDRPFMFTVQDTQTGFTVFVGRHQGPDKARGTED